MDDVASAGTAGGPPCAAESGEAGDSRGDTGAATTAAPAGGDTLGHVDGANYMPRVNSDGWVRYPTVLERYYKTYTTSNHQCLHIHSNGVCILGVAPSHPMLQPPNKVTAIAYRTHDSKNLMQTSVSGKKKAGAVFVLPRDMVCTVTYADADGATNTVTLYGCVRASVVEVNHRLLANPALLGTPEGYLAVLLPKLDEKKGIGGALLEFERETPLNVESTNSKRRAEGKQVRSTSSGGSKKQKTATKLCWAFAQRGSCSFGDKCRFSHYVEGEQPSECAAVVAAPLKSDAAEGGGSEGTALNVAVSGSNAQAQSAAPPPPTQADDG